MALIMSTISNFFKMIMDSGPAKDATEDVTMLTSDEVNELLTLHNKTRNVYNLPPMVLDEDCSLVARSHAIWMSNSQNISHMGFSFFGPVQRMAIVGKEPENIGECISYSIGPEVKDLMRAWFTSESHRNIILGKYDRFGVGRVLGPHDNNYYWCAIYSTAKGAHNVPNVKMSESIVDF
jgi:uncharacterized protein YkwD